jgi:hypothetical protein
MCEKVKGSWTRVVRVLLSADYAMTIQKSIVDSTVDSTEEESDFDKSCYSECSEESAGAYEQAAGWST